MERIATPGAFKLPAGAKDRERFEALEGRVVQLETTVEFLASVINDLMQPEAPAEGEAKTGRRKKD